MAACAVFSAACGVHLEDVPRRALAQTSFVYAADDSVITELHAVEDRVVLPTSQIPSWIRDAAVAIEDRRFYLHHGIDGRAILRASYVNFREGNIEEGGSTITQQLVKNLYTGGDQTIARKLSEASLAWQLEDRLSKDEILTRVPQHRVLRAGCVRRPSRRANVLRDRRGRAHARAVRSARGIDHEPGALRSLRVPAPRDGKAPRGPPIDGRVRDGDGRPNAVTRARSRSTSKP